ncbi:MAG: hypothetical protein ACFFDF_24015 [Candidatus Odinarchaeota archaeon]
MSFGQSVENKAENLGLMSELIYIKITSENYAIRIINDTLIKQVDKIKFVNLYNDTKAITDQIIVQLIADSRRKNSLRFVRKLDNLLVKKNINQISEIDFHNKKLKGYVKNIKKSAITYSQLMDFKITDDSTKNPLNILGIKGFFPSAISGEELTGMLSFVTATIKDVKESKEKKVEKLTEILDNLRLSPLQDLAKSEKKDDEK